MRMFLLADLIEAPISGEWGIEPTDDGVKVIRTTNFTNEGRIDLSNVVIRDIEAKKIEKKKLQDGDIIIEKSGGSPTQPVGRVVFFDVTDDTYLCNNFTAVLRPKEGVFPKYLFYIMYGLHLTKATLAFQNKTTGIINLKLTNYLNKVKIPLPPLEEQKRIAAVLDKADRLRQQDRQLLAKYDQLLQSVFLDMFGDPVKNEKRWEVKAVSQIGRVVTGNTPSRAVPRYYGDCIEWIKSDNINTPSHYLTTAKEFLSDEGKRVGRTVSGDSVLITCIAGSPNCIGNIAIAGREVAFNQQINAIIPNRTLLELEFLYAQILIGKKLVQQASTNGMKGMVSKAKLEDVELMVPPLHLQRDFKELFYKVIGQIHIQQQTSAKSESLYQSLLQKAFKGELELKEVEVETSLF
jgi:type I restriction enzyme, S subunit